MFDQVIEMRFEECESRFRVDTVEKDETLNFASRERSKVELTILRRSTRSDTFLSVATILRALPSSPLHRGKP